MCEEADKYGIKVIVDVVPNHTTKSTEALGEGLLNAVGGIDNLYHKKERMKYQITKTEANVLTRQLAVFLMLIQKTLPSRIILSTI